ncbi:MAG: Bug family tripartite tricarboxylate transporter substrate binding protein [Usitatibacter sp.]
MNRRTFVRAFCAAILAAGSCAGSIAQDAYPAKPIKIIVPFPPGGGTDVLSRAIAQSITNNTKWVFVVDNRPGAGGNIGLDAAAKSPPDGYTIAMGQTANLAVNPALYPSLPFDPLKDFEPIVAVSSQPLILVVGKDSPYKTLKDLVDAAKAKPGQLNMGSPGSGTIGHIGGELFQRRAGVKFAHIPYKGAAPAVTDLMGGSVDLYFGNSQSVDGLVKGGRIRAIAVTSPKRLKNMPDVPTIAESGYPGFEAATWSGLVAPKGTPKAIVDRLNAEANKALKSPDMIAKLDLDGSEPLGGSPQRFAEFLKAEHAKWGAVIKEAGIKLE